MGHPTARIYKGEIGASREPVSTGRNRSKQGPSGQSTGRMSHRVTARGLAVSPQYARVRAHIMGYYKCQAIAFRTTGAEPAPARARLANAAPARTAAAETMVAFAQVPRRRPADPASRRLSSSVGSSGAYNTRTVPDG
jgi:hypothetical protein